MLLHVFVYNYVSVYNSLLQMIPLLHDFNLTGHLSPLTLRQTTESD